MDVFYWLEQRYITYTTPQISPYFESVTTVAKTPNNPVRPSLNGVEKAGSKTPAPIHHSVPRRSPR
jgi:hypothetical protein